MLWPSLPPLVEASTLKRIVVISSGIGDVPATLSSGIKLLAPYSISKAAVNIAVAKFYLEYRDRGVLVMAVSPGVVATKFAQDGTAEGAAEVARGMAELGAEFKAKNPDWTGVPYSANAAAANVLAVVAGATIGTNGGIMVSHHGNTEWL